MRKRKELPDRWEWKQLNEVTKIGAGNGAPQGDKYYNDGKYPFVRTYDVGQAERTMCLKNPRDKINDIALEECKLKLWPKNTLLLPKSGASTFLNHRALLGEESYVSSHLATIIPEDSLLPKYLYYWSLNLDAKQLTPDTNYPSLRLSDIGIAYIPIPPLDIQQKIVDILDSIEELKSLREDANKTADQLIPSVFLQMFGDPVKNPKGWDVEDMGNITHHVSSGSTPKGGSQVYSDSGIVFIRSQNVLMNNLSFGDVAYISDEIHNSMKRSWVKHGDVLFNITGASIGRVSWYPDEDNTANVNQHVCIIRPNKKIMDSIFLSYLMSLNTFQKKIFATQAGATRQAFNYSQIKKFSIIVPPISLQQQFADFVQSIEDLKSSQANSADTMNEMFNSFLDKAFKGELVC